MPLVTGNKGISAKEKRSNCMRKTVGKRFAGQPIRRTGSAVPIYSQNAKTSPCAGDLVLPDLAFFSDLN
jgi:hypothetical protein